MRISDWSSDVCSSDLVHTLLTGNAASGIQDHGPVAPGLRIAQIEQVRGHRSIERRRTRDNDLVRHAGFEVEIDIVDAGRRHRQAAADVEIRHRSEEHTSELQSLMRISYAVFCLKKKKQYKNLTTINIQHTRSDKN